MSTAGDSIELFGPLSELHVHGGWKLLDASETSGPRDSHSFCFDASRRAGQNCALGCAKVESPQCPLLQSTVYYVKVESRSKITFYMEATVNCNMHRCFHISYINSYNVSAVNYYIWIALFDYTYIYIYISFLDFYGRCEQNRISST